MKYWIEENSKSTDGILWGYIFILESRDIEGFCLGKLILGYPRTGLTKNLTYSFDPHSRPLTNLEYVKYKLLGHLNEE